MVLDVLENPALDRMAAEARSQGKFRDLPPLPPRHPSMQVFGEDRVERARDARFERSSACAGLLVRKLTAADRHCDGKVTARILKTDPSAPFQPPATATQVCGVKLAYVLSGGARIEIEGLGEVEIDKGALVCLPPNNRHRLVSVTPEFAAVEFELPMITATLSRTWSKGGASLATEAMVDRVGADSFEAIANFDGAVERYMRVVQEVTGGAAKLAVLKANPPHVWDGSPWHVHHNNFICALFTNGSGVMGYEAYGDLPLEPGDFFVQQGEIRHREVVMSPDFEILALELPAVSPTTVLIHDKETDAYRTMLFTSAQDAGEAFD